MIDQRWNVRRRMAKTSFIAGLLYPVAIMAVGDSTAAHLLELSAPFYTFVTFNITAYVTAVTYSDTSNRP